MSRRWLLLLPLLALPVVGPAPCPSGGARVAQQYLHLPSFVEPHTPGSGAPEEVAASDNLRSILGPAPDLNRVSYVRTFLDRELQRQPEIAAILRRDPPFFTSNHASFFNDLFLCQSSVTRRIG